MAKLRNKKRARSLNRSGGGDSPAAKKLANGNNSEMDDDSEISFEDPVLSEVSTCEELTRDDSDMPVSFAIISVVDNILMHFVSISSWTVIN